MRRRELRRRVAERARLLTIAVLIALVAVLLASSGGEAASGTQSRSIALAAAVGPNVATTTPSGGSTDGAPSPTTATTATAAAVSHPRHRHRRRHPLPRPKRLRPFRARLAPHQGHWWRSGRKVGRYWAVYRTTLIPPYGTQRAGIAWMDTRLLAARLYSGSESPGGGPYKYSAPIRAAQARKLVAAFNGGFKMNAAEGGYYTEHRTIYPLRAGAASLVIYRGGSVNIGSWGGHLKMTRNVIAVRQNLVMLVSGHHLTARAKNPDWLLWGWTCGVSSCSGPGLDHQWRSAVGMTADHALVYVQGPGLSPYQLGRLLLRAGVVKGMELDINPYWPIFAIYKPATRHGLASAANGRSLLPGTTQTPGTFFESWWGRDFITMSVRR